VSSTQSRPALKKRLAEEIHSKLPYQRYNDSPTVKQYTDWKKIESAYAGEPSGPDSALVSPRELVEYYDAVVELSGGGFLVHKASGLVSMRTVPADAEETFNLFNPEEGRLIAEHMLRTRETLEITVHRGSGARVALVVSSPQRGGRSYHVVFSAMEGSSSEVDVVWAAQGSAGAVLLTMENLLDRGSRLESRLVSLSTGGGMLVSWRRAVLEKEATLVYRSAVVGGASRIQDESVQAGEGSSSVYRAFLFSGNGGSVEYVSNSINDRRGTATDVAVRGFSLKGRLTHRGTVRATGRAIGSVNKLLSRLVPLAEGSAVFSVPSLEVEADVLSEGTHSSDVSGLSSEELFYINSRGLSESEAVALLVASYLEGALSPTSASLASIAELALEEALRVLGAGY